MDPHSNTEAHDEPEAGRPPVRREETMKNAVAQWTPEDASRFLSAAIHEAQRPLADALRHRPVSTPVLALIIALLVVAGAAIGWILSNQLEKSESAADKARREREAAVEKSYELQSRSDTLSMRLKATEEQHERAVRDYTSETERLRTESAGLRDSEQDLRRTMAELARHRRQNELLRNQISGLEMEKQALARQLDAVKALMLSDDEDAFAGPEIPDEPIPAPPSAANAMPAMPAAPASSASSASPAMPAMPAKQESAQALEMPATSESASSEMRAVPEMPAAPETPAPSESPEASKAPEAPESPWEAPDTSSAAPEPDSAETADSSASGSEAPAAAEADEPAMAY